MEDLKVKSTEHWLVHDHTRFEVLCSRCRDAADIEDWWDTEKFLDELIDGMRYHMAQEEEVLFPAYEDKRQKEHLSTLVLCNEHSVIVDAFRRVKKCVEERDAEKILDEIVLLELLISTHNEKEEMTFLPFASHLLFDDREALIKQLDEFVVTKKSRQWFSYNPQT